MVAFTPSNGSFVSENVPVCFIVAPVFGCSAPDIDVFAAFDVTSGEPDNVFVDVSGDGVDDAVALAVAADVPAGRRARVKVDVIYSSCPPLSEATAFDYIVQADACHQGDAAPAGFFGAACPGSNDAGFNPNLVNDAPIQKVINDMLR